MDRALSSVWCCVVCFLHKVAFFTVYFCLSYRSCSGFIPVLQFSRHHHQVAAVSSEPYRHRQTHTHTLSLSLRAIQRHTHTHTHTHTHSQVAAVSSEPYRDTDTHTHSEPYRDTHTHTHTHTHSVFFLFWECHEHAQTWGLLIAWTPRCLPHGSSFLNIGSRCKAGKGQGPCSRGGST